MNNNLNSYLFILISLAIYSSCTTADFDEDNTNPYYIETEHQQEGQERDYLNDGFITIAHWNIGHFSQGKSSDTSITAQDSDSLKELYLDMIQKTNPDIFGICEYNPSFNTNGEKTAHLLLSSFPFSYIGKKYNYNCNAIFSHLPLYNCTLHSFSERVQSRYYSVADFMLNGNTVKFVETHLDFNQDVNGQECRLSQMQELTDAFKDYPYVIICADYNSRKRDEYNVFLENGFSMATDNLPNAGSPSTDNSQIMIDNIIVKGFQVVETVVYPHNSLSDHDLLWCYLMIDE